MYPILYAHEKYTNNKVIHGPIHCKDSRLEITQTPINTYKTGGRPAMVILVHSQNGIPPAMKKTEAALYVPVWNNL